MGFYRTTAVDYFVIVKPVSITTTDIESKCSKCGKRSWDKFCASCGGKIVSVEKPKTITTDDLRMIINGDKKLQDEYDEWFFTPEFRPKGFSAINFSTVKKNHKDENKYFAMSSDDLNPVEMLPEAKLKLNKFLADYRSIYGEDSIELKYGIYSYDS